MPLDIVENLPAGSTDLLDHVIQKEQIEKLSREIQRLKADEIEILQLHYTAQLTYSEI